MFFWKKESSDGIDLLFCTVCGFGFFFFLQSSIVFQHLKTNYKLTTSSFIISRTAERVWFFELQMGIEDENLHKNIKKGILVRLGVCLAQYPASKPEAGALLPLLGKCLSLPGSTSSSKSVEPKLWKDGWEPVKPLWAGECFDWLYLAQSLSQPLAWFPLGSL